MGTGQTQKATGEGGLFVSHEGGDLLLIEGILEILQGVL